MLLHAAVAVPVIGIIRVVVKMIVLQLKLIEKEPFILVPVVNTQFVELKRNVCIAQVVYQHVLIHLTAAIHARRIVVMLVLVIMIREAVLTLGPL